MTGVNGITLAAKCAPDERLLNYINDAGIKAVELFTNERIMEDMDGVARLCGQFKFKYAIHAPNTGCSPERLLYLVESIKADVVVTHNIYWEDEWEEFEAVFRGFNGRFCIENTSSIHEPARPMRRFGFGRCLDLEHLQMECCGIFEEEFVRVIKEASHIHLTGYKYGSELWHTHLHANPETSAYFLDLLVRSGYKGMVVSEARPSMQTAGDFKDLARFFADWAGGA